MKLVSVYREKKAIGLLFDLLKTRGPHVSISHKTTPSKRQHAAFVRSHPYRAWYLISVSDDYVGSIYLTERNEIGIFLFPEQWGKRYAQKAIRMLMDKHPRKSYLANINPRNTKSIRLFQRLGFEWIENTYELVT